MTNRETEGKNNADENISFCVTEKLKLFEVNKAHYKTRWQYMKRCCEYEHIAIVDYYYYFWHE